VISVNKIRVFFLIQTLSVIAGCFSQGDGSSSCPPVLDTVKTLLEKTYAGNKYFLVERISGWHDKAIIIQLFDKPPVLGECNQDVVVPIFEDSIELNKPLVKLVADIAANEFTLIYGRQSGSIALEFVENNNPQ